MKTNIIRKKKRGWVVREEGKKMKDTKRMIPRIPETPEKVNKDTFINPYMMMLRV